MAETTTIEWTDATVNFWWGCTKVGPGCDWCYAESWAKRTGFNIWGIGAPRRKIASAVKTLHRLDNDYAWWAADCQIGQLHDHPRRRVFIQSMSDLFDKEVPIEWFDEAWQTITRCDRLDIQIVTKRISFVEKRLAGKPWPKHAGLLISIVNQEEADRDIPRLLDLKARLGIPWVGLSMEPLLGPVDLTSIKAPRYPEEPAEDLEIDWRFNALEVGDYYWFDGSDGHLGDGSDGPYREHRIDWVIVGGESGAHARPMHPDWVRSLRDQCANATLHGDDAPVPFLFKQHGEWVSVSEVAGPGKHFLFPDGATVRRVGKKLAGRLLDGVQHDGFPA